MATHVVCASPALVQRTPPDFSLSFLYLTLEVGAGGVNGQRRPQSWNHIGTISTTITSTTKTITTTKTTTTTTTSTTSTGTISEAPAQVRNALQCNVCNHDISEAPLCVCKEDISETPSYTVQCVQIRHIESTHC